MTLLYIKLTRYIYTLLHYLAIPGILLRLLWRSRQAVSYRKRWNERFGYIERIDRPSIWVHAVSVGEALAAIPLIKSLKKQFPDHNLMVTTTTPTGSAQVKKHLDNEVTHVYAPYDIPDCVYRFLRRSNTKLCIIMETELWPNLLRCCKLKNIPVMLANARISERSKRNYKLVRHLTKTMLQTYNIVAAQGLLDGERLLELGLDPDKLIISGNIKFDLELDENTVKAGKQLRIDWHTQNRPTLIAASTHDGEEKIILDAFKSIREHNPELLLMIAPRHPERFASVSELCETKGFRVALRSKQENPSNSDILLADTMGELRMLYAAADIAFVGGSLVNVGGHNLIEPAAIELPILTGPHLHNFVEISKLLKSAGALQIVRDATELAEQVNALLLAQNLCTRMGKQAKRVVESNSGALAKHMEWIFENYPNKSTIA